MGQITASYTQKEYYSLVLVTPVMSVKHLSTQKPSEREPGHVLY